MEISTMYAALAAFIAALIALGVYHLAVAGPALRRLRELTGTHDQLIGGGSSASERLAQLDGSLGVVQTALERVTGRVGELEALARTDLSRVGFVRYDAFDDTGSELSYAVALLNREGDGAVFSSIYSRTDTRTYGKVVTGYQPAVNASEEELLAISRARTAKA
jgi:hypothetical protein